MTVCDVMAALTLSTAMAGGNGAPVWQPKEADLLLFDSRSGLPGHPVYQIWTGGSITHCGIVVKDREGQLCLLEAAGKERKIGLGKGPVTMTEVLERVWHEDGQTWLRVNKKPLTEEQSARLTDFAYRQLGKPYSGLKAVGLLGKEPTSRRPRPLREENRWFCGELVAAACIETGLMTHYVKPRGVDPEDLFSDDHNFDISRRWISPHQVVLERNPLH